jgi:hypothetical protein
LIIDRSQGDGIGDPPRHPINHPDLLSINIAAPEPLPHRRQAGSEPARPGQQAAHRIGLIPQHHRQLIGDKFTRLGPVRSRHIAIRCSSGFLCDPSIGVPHRHFGQPSLRSRSLPASIRHRLPRIRCGLFVIPRHAFIVAAPTDRFRTYDLHIRLSAVDA